MIHIETINGFQVALCHLPTPVISIQAIINAGSCQDETEGTAHFLEHLFFKGTEKRGYKQLNQDLASIGSSNAYTSTGRTVYLIDTIPKHIITAFDTLCEMLFLPALTQEEMEKERTVILEEWQSGQDDPIRYFLDESLEFLLPRQLGHRTIGTKDSIEKMDMEQIKAFRKTHYTSENLIFSIVGDISDLPKEQIANILSNYSLPTGTTNQIPKAESKLGTWDSPSQFDFEHTSSQACLGLWMPSLTLPESYDLHFADDIASNMIGQGMHSLLFDRLREQLGLCYATGLFELNHRENVFGCAYALLDHSNVTQAIGEIRKIIQDVSKGNFADELLQTAKSNVLFELANESQTSGGFAHMYLDGIWGVRQMEPSLEGRLTFDFLRDQIESCDIKQLRQAAIQTAQKFMEGLAIFTMNGQKK